MDKRPLSQKKVEQSISQDDLEFVLQSLEGNRKKKKEKPQQVDIKATRIFYETFNSQEKIIINRGGAGSSKSYSLAQVFCQKFLTEKNKKFIILRKSLPSLRVSVYLTMKEVLDTFQATDMVKEEKVGFNWYYAKNMLHFGSVDDPEKLKSSDWNYIWLEEATEFTYDEYNIIKLRLRAPTTDGFRNQIYMSFNPIDEFHWIKEQIIDKANEGKLKDVKEIHSTWKDNPFLPEDYTEQLQALVDQDINYYRIYTLGEWGKLEDLIYTNWDIVDNIPQDSEMDVCYGVDFGYNAPAALIRIWIAKGKTEVWEEELMYKTGLTNKDLIRHMQVLIPPEHQRKVKIYADSAEPDRIKEIYEAGFKTIKPAQKSVQDGIDSVKRLRCHVLSSSDHLIKEKRAYSWQRNKKTGKIEEEKPINFMNHLMDAERYAIHTHLKGTKQVSVRWL